MPPRRHRPRRPSSSPAYPRREFLFAPGELAALRCACGCAVVASEPELNDLGELLQFGFCPLCSLARADAGQPCLWVPEAARHLRRRSSE